MTQVQNLTNLFTPGGRFVSGDLDRKQDKDYENKPIPAEEQEYYFAVAVAKTQPGINEILGQLHGLASQAYATNPMILQQIGMGLNAMSFSWKVEDGDVPKMDAKTGQPKAIPEYIQGCFVFKFRTKYEFGACDAQGNEINRADIKRGDYVDVMFTASPNGRVDGNAGIILYPIAVRRLGFGEAISGQVSASAAFANQGASLPPGATAQPTAAGATPMAQGQQGNGMPAAQQGQMAQNGNMGMPPASGGNPAATGMPAANPNVQAGGMMQGQGGMPAAGQAGMTASPSDPAAMGVQPHNGILHGPGGQQGGMPAAGATMPPAGGGGGMPGT